MLQRKRIHIEGIVQGVGFRPFVYQTAVRLGLSGRVLNDSRGVEIEVQGERPSIDSFLQVLKDDLPPLASVTRCDVADIPIVEGEGFTIAESRALKETSAQITPDTHVCDDCLRELFDPSDRRFRYPFINCTNCGPRYTIVTGTPYDRPKTTMGDFPLCPECRSEYDDPASRRFHAQPNACPVCGPTLSFLDSSGMPVVTDDPLGATVELLKTGRIVAVKGLGGYHLVVDAANGEAVAELRRRKARDEKPFAMMLSDIRAVESVAELDAKERALLQSVERPIVLLRKKEGAQIAPEVAPKNRYYGIMLPYTPLHHLLLAEGFGALVMTSANLSDEPIVYDDEAALTTLAGIADAYLTHDRRIHIRTDDSIARVMAGRPLLIRRSRGYVPRSLLLPCELPPVFAVGGELKNAICLTRGERAFLSQHVGDLKNAETLASLVKTADHLKELLAVEPAVVAHDLHPDYLSTSYAERFDGARRVAVQHHHAHLASCLAENRVTEDAIGVIFDGIGYGADGTIWGGEFLFGNMREYERVGHLARLTMPGGDAATREPYRMAISALMHAYGPSFPRLPFLDGLREEDLSLLKRMVERGINAPLTSSCGRLFDAVAALCGLRRRVSYEGQAALELEMILEGDGGAPYRFAVRQESGCLVADPAPMIREVVDDLQRGAPPSVVSRRFHDGLSTMTVEVCRGIRQTRGVSNVALSGGVFQNRVLTERTLCLLEGEGFTVFTHSLVPPNDGGLALGQAVVAGLTSR